jgi:CelD/BcsL family acetyltransferase involved in cellulose biosynthesis
MSDRCRPASHLPLEAIRIQSFAELAAWSREWNALGGGNPFLSYEWLDAWWRNYEQHSGRAQRGRELYILLVCDAWKRLVGIAPVYVERTTTQGRVLRFLGGGETCSEYVSIRCEAGFEDDVAATLADWLTEANLIDEDDRWDVLKLAAVDQGDPVVGRLLDHLEDRGHRVDRKPGVNRWRIELPATWDDYLATLSKCHRKKLRRLERDDFDSGRVLVHWVHSQADLDRALSILVDLHQRRWQTQGKSGCFASRRFLQFHHDVTAQLLSGNALLMNWLELDGRPIAATYDLGGGGGVYAYQSGIDPESLDRQPGRLMNLASIRRAIERGDQFYDLLRGDEPYKANWRATPRPSYDAHVVPSRTSARLRFQVSAAAENVHRLLKSSRRFAENLING